MKQQSTYSKIHIKEFKRCLQFYYNLKYESRKLKLKDISFFTSSYSPFQYLKATNERFAEVKMTLSIEDSVKIHWMLDKYFRLDCPEDLTRKGLEEYFDNMNDDIVKYIHQYQKRYENDKQIQDFTKNAKSLIEFGQKYNRYNPEEIPALITEENFSSKNIKKLLKKYFLDGLKLHLAYLYVNVTIGSEILADIYPKKPLNISFRLTRSHSTLQKLYEQLIKHNYIQDVEFSIFQKHFSEVEIDEKEKLTWNKTNVLLAFFCKYLEENDYISVGESIWQKTQICFKNQLSKSLSASYSQTPFPKGHEKLKSILDDLTFI